MTVSLACSNCGWWLPLRNNSLRSHITWVSVLPMGQEKEVDWQLIVRWAGVNISYSWLDVKQASVVSPNTLSTGTLGGRPWAKALSGSTCVKSKWIPLSAACHSSCKKSQLTPWGYQGLIKDESRDRRILYHMAMSPLPECSRRKKICYNSKG